MRVKEKERISWGNIHQMGFGNSPKRNPGDDSGVFFLI
jgi:hypothetical protein